ncbi:hypothetical protein [uncultured Erythrobacter sp.]|uniref:hypothetical protein n=1 Tax=uncultured Erythrobacter sp. TaxID=263913 RepID=UPI0026030F40|nr:hypothetical protein [uncultured Erythrobacter sp.]
MANTQENEAGGQIDRRKGDRRITARDKEDRRKGERRQSDVPYTGPERRKHPRT